MKMVLDERGQFDCNISYFDDGYTADEISCIDLPIAACAGYIVPEYYYYYCFNYVFTKNWCINDLNGFYDFRNQLLSPIGLGLSTIRIDSKDDFIPAIRSSLASQEPILLFLHRQTLVYDQGYADKDYDSLHGIIVSGYNEKNPAICIRDIAHIERSGARYLGNGYGFFRLWLKESLLTEMWLESNKLEPNMEIHSVITKLVHSAIPIVHSYTDLIKRALKIATCHESQFVQILRENSFDLSTLKDENQSAFFRTKYILPMKVIFDGILKAAKENDMDTTKITLFMKKYLNIRLIAVNKLCISAYKGRSFKEKVKDDLVKTLAELDEQLFAVMWELNVN